MKEIFTEKEYTEAVQKVNEKMLNDFYNNLNNVAILLPVTKQICLQPA